MDFAYEYAEMAASARFEDLPSHTVEMTKRFLLDTLGVAIAGANRGEAQNIETCIKSIFDIEHLDDVTDIIEYLT